jgi:hypothetical protein
LAAIIVGALALAACGAGSTGRATSTAAPAVMTAAPGSAAASTPTPRAASATATLTTTSATPPAGDTGIEGIATLGPTCPVERPDSPCPDRPYEARITIWSGATMVAETRSGVDGRFRVSLPPGDYRVVGEPDGTFPHASEQAVTVVEGRLTPVQIRFDSGIR